jgi:hypothetical protein
LLLIASHASARDQTDERRKNRVCWESSHSKANVRCAGTGQQLEGEGA